MRTRDMSPEQRQEHRAYQRKYSEIAPQITEDGITEVKNQRAQFVKNYFTEKKHQFGLK